MTLRAAALAFLATLPANASAQLLQRPDNAIPPQQIRPPAQPQRTRNEPPPRPGRPAPWFGIAEMKEIPTHDHAFEPVIGFGNDDFWEVQASSVVVLALARPQM